MLNNFVRRLGLPDAESDDVTQEVLLVAQRALQDGGYDPGKGRFRRWLYGVAKKRTLTAMRNRARRTRTQAVASDGGVDFLSQIEDKSNDESMKEIWQQEWRYALLDEALRHVQEDISEKVFQAFTLYAVEQWPVNKVAQQLDIAPASVYVYKTRVLAAIREWIKCFEDG